MLTLIEKAQEVVDIQQAEEMERKLRKATFDLQDFLDQLRAVQKMGPLGQVLEMVPGMKGRLKAEDVDEAHLKGVEAIVLSMNSPGAAGPERVERLPSSPHRRGQRHKRARGKPTAESVPADAKNDEAFFRRQDQAHRGPAATHASIVLDVH